MCFEAKSLELAGSCQQIIFREQRNDYVTARWADTFLPFGFHGFIQEITGSFRGCYLVCWAWSDKTTVHCTAGHFWIFTVC